MGNEWIYIDTLTNIFESYLLYILLNMFLDKNLKTMYLNFIDTFFIIFTGVMATILNNVFNISDLICVFLVCICWFFYYIIFYHIREWFKIITYIVVYWLIMIITEYVVVLSSILFIKNTEDFLANNILNFILLIISKSSAYFIIKFIEHKKIRFGLKEKIQVFSILIIIFLDIISSILLADAYKQLSDYSYYTTIIVFITIVLCLLNIMIILVLNFICKYIEKEIDLKVQKNYYEGQKSHIENYNNMIVEIRRIQHDYNNHLAVIYAYLNNNCYLATKEYVKDLVKIARDTTEKIKTNISTIESIIDYKIDIAKEKGIEVFLESKINKHLNINENDIAVILFNTIDNAIEACDKIVDKQKYIKMKISINENYFNYYLENSSTGIYKHNNLKFASTKENKSGHGYGLQNVRYIVENNNGFIDIIPEIDKYSIRISMTF